MNSSSSSSVALILCAALLLTFSTTDAFVASRRHRPAALVRVCSSPEDDEEPYKAYRSSDNGAVDSNMWISEDQANMDSSAWEANLAAKEDGRLWSSFEPSDEDMNATMTDEEVSSLESTQEEKEDLENQDAWLDTLAQLSNEEAAYNIKEADIADKARQMADWGFSQKAIANTFDVATDLSLEEDDEGMQAYREEAFSADMLDDLSLVESHTKVEMDPQTGEPVRQQMIYVDEVACIGCTNCAMVADNTFYMNEDYGRARVYSQWGDDDETVAIAIETCPVDCIHYIPFDELKRLEVERRAQNINFKARLVGTGELSDKVGGAIQYTPAQQISGNMGSRCNNCPSRGCKNCPMFGVGKNPEFEKREKIRFEKQAKRKLQQEREKQNKSVDL